ncbi:MAG: hypothetical protein ACP5JG_15600 [Anaerolineae bacterium]
MGLRYKEDWEETKARLRLWWGHEYFGRCALAVTAPRDDPPERPVPPQPSTLQEKWYDLDAVAERNDYRFSQTFYGGEAIPVWHAGYPGIASIPTILGCPFELNMETGWHDPLLTDRDGFDVRSLRLDKDHPAYRYHMSVLARAMQECPGKAFPSMGAFYHGGDTLAALRGTEQLLFDCIERPAAVRDAEDWLMDMWFEFYDHTYAAVNGAAQGSACWMGVWAPGKTYTVSNDFSYNISTSMFCDMFLPAIERQLGFLDYSIYHVDGVGAFRHVDALCGLPGLQALQILPGAGQPSPLHFMDVLKKVQAAGKNLHISISPEEVEEALSMLSARGLYIVTHAKNQTLAEELLEQVESWSVDRG